MKSAIGLGSGAMFCSIFLAYGLIFWMGYVRTAEDVEDNCIDNCVTGNQVMVVTNLTPFNHWSIVALRLTK